jgi:hypothetical protein
MNTDTSIRLRSSSIRNWRRAPRGYAVTVLAVRDGLLDRNPARISRWQREYKLAEDELDDPRSLALPDWAALMALADALVARSADRYQGWGDAVIFETCIAARIGEVSGCLVRDINSLAWQAGGRTNHGIRRRPGGQEHQGTAGAPGSVDRRHPRAGSATNRPGRW